MRTRTHMMLAVAAALALSTSNALASMDSGRTTVSSWQDLATSDGVSQIAKRSKPRVPGGSGCDDPRDVIEHPECAV